MSGGRRKWVSGGENARWRVQWAEGGNFKIEHESDNLMDQSVEEWGTWLDGQIYDRFGGSPPQLCATVLNFSRNGLGDAAVQAMVEYLRSRRIAVQTLKLFRNNIGDVGAWAIGQLLAHCEMPVHEVHLSHNVMTEQGACSLLESIARCGRYPFNAENSGRRDPRGLAPVWLRLEHNRIGWDAIEHRLELRQMQWCAAESRDGWTPKDRAPMVCLHSSYQNQTADQGGAGYWSGGVPDPPPAEAPLNGQLILAALQGDGAAKQSLDAQLGQKQRAAPPGAAAVTAASGDLPRASPAPSDPRASSKGSSVHAAAEAAAAAEAQEGEGEDVPLYVFLDAGAVCEMMTRQDGLFTFESLLNLCQQGHMKCAPPDQRRMPEWLGPVEEHECVMLVVTDAVLNELAAWSQRDAALRQKVEWLRTAPDSYLQRCLEWGIIEVLETALHTQLMRLTSADMNVAQAMRVPDGGLKMLDFACLWESQIVAEGRVLLVTTSPALREFGGRLAGRCPPVVLCEALNRRFAEDTATGGQRLCEASRRPRADKFCGAALSAQLLAALSGVPSLQGASRAPPAPPPPPTTLIGGATAVSSGSHVADLTESSVSEANALRLALQEAVAIVGNASRLLSDEPDRRGSGGSGEAARLAARMADASKRWQALLEGRYAQLLD